MLCGMPTFAATTEELQSAQRSRLSSAHSLSLSTPFIVTFALPCLLPNAHSPSYLSPFGLHERIIVRTGTYQCIVPYPCLRSFLYSPMYIFPSGKVKVPFPFILLSRHWPTYFRPSDHVYVPKNSNSLCTFAA